VPSAISVRTWRILAPLDGRDVRAMLWRRVRKDVMEAQVWDKLVSGEYDLKRILDSDLYVRVFGASPAKLCCRFLLVGSRSFSVQIEVLLPKPKLRRWSSAR
jgi:hypothetical protein